MKIGNTSETSSPDIPRHNDVSASNPMPNATRADDATDQLKLSPAGRLTRTTDVSGEFRADKVAQIKFAIENDAFKIDTDAVAQEIIHETASLLQALSKVTMPEPPPESSNRDYSTQNSQEKFGAGPANERSPGPDR